MAGLRIKNGPSQGQTFTIGEKALVIGRDEACDISLQDKGASRRHAEVFSIGSMCFIRDLESRNGSFVNDNRITEEMLRDGDRIQIGGTIIIFESMGGIAESDDIEFSEEELDGFFELRLEDLTSMNVGEGDMLSETHLRAIYRVSRIVANEDTEEHLIKNALPVLCETFQADGAYIFGRDAEKGNIVTLGSYAPKGRSGQLSKTIIRKVLQDKRAILVTDAMRDDRFSSHESVMRHNIHSVACAPLALSGDLQGVLYLAGDDPAISFNEKELELAAAIADQLGVALSHLASQVKRREYALSAIRMMLRVADVDSPGIKEHNEKIAAFMLSIGKATKVKSSDLDELQLSALLHNYAIMTNPKDSISEADIPARSAELLSGEIFYPEIADVVKYQKECFDGSGPLGKRKSELPLSVRIFQVASDLVSEWEALGSTIDTLDHAIKKVSDQPGQKYDPSVISALGQANAAGLLRLTLDDHWRRLRETSLAAQLHDEQ